MSSPQISLVIPTNASKFSLKKLYRTTFQFMKIRYFKKSAYRRMRIIGDVFHCKELTHKCRV